jgi:hypothetical protein
MRDDTLPHQIRLFFTGGTGRIAVSCNCQVNGEQRNAAGPVYRPLDSRTQWEPHEPMEVWRAHMAEVEAAS